jgi:hypothetical protein
MPYQVESICTACGQGDSFVIGNWPEDLGVYVCPVCQAPVNIPVETSECPGCGQGVEPEDCYDYSFSIPYLGGQFIHEPEPGPDCPKCGRAPLAFETTTHLNMGMVVDNREKALATWGRESMEKAIVINSALAVIEELQLDLDLVLAYFNLDVPKKDLITNGLSFPIILDIRMHLGTALMIEPEKFGCQMSPEEVKDFLFGEK